jgi:hypothetical protein
MLGVASVLPISVDLMLAHSWSDWTLPALQAAALEVADTARQLVATASASAGEADLVSGNHTTSTVVTSGLTSLARLAETAAVTLQRVLATMLQNSVRILGSLLVWCGTLFSVTLYAFIQTITFVSALYALVRPPTRPTLEPPRVGTDAVGMVRVRGPGA